MIFLTGFPGFIGRRLVRRLADAEPTARFALLVQQKFAGQAKLALKRMRLHDRAEVIPGDIRQMDLGIREGRTRLQMSITKAFHLAAAYDLSVPRRIARRINVDGTRHVLNFLEPCPEFEVLGYASTAYVAGRRTGAVYESELLHDAGFKNYYEESKYEAEVLVRERMSVLPTVVLRPSIVVGDSATGETDKLDGLYLVLRLLRSLPAVTLAARLGRGTRPVNVVPVDFVTSAIARLTDPQYAGKTFHLCDPNPLSAQEVLELFLDLLGKEAAVVPIPASLARMAVSTPAGTVLGLTPQVVDYFDHPAYYDTTNAENALAPAGISCPPLPEYAPRMVDYLDRHEREIRARAMY